MILNKKDGGGSQKNMILWQHSLWTAPSAQLINIRILGWWKLNSIVVTTVLQSIWKQKSSQQNHHLLSNFIFCPLENTTSGRSVSKTWEICMTLTVCAQNMIMTPFQYLKLHWTQSLFHFIWKKEKNSNSRK